MSYRAFKRLLGETSLERKCRFLFGAFILLLITSSFWYYARETEHLAYAQIDTEAGALGFDKDYFVQQVAGLTQLAGEFMLVDPLVIDLGWGKLKSALVKLKDSAFLAPRDAAANRRMLGDQYVAAFRQVEAAAHDKAGMTLKDLATSISARVVSERQHALRVLVDEQRAKLA